MEAYNGKKRAPMSTNLAHKFTINKLIFLNLCMLLLVRAVVGENYMESGPVVSSSALLLFLEQVQQSALATFGSSNFDPKHYVDLPLRFNLSETQRAFQGLPSANILSAERLNGFLNEYFGEVGSDLVTNDPTDFSAEPEGFFPGVVNQEVRKWALEVHLLWKVLSRKVGKSVAERPDGHTPLPLPGGVIIPGSRFREVYYWDSYWIIRDVNDLYLQRIQVGCCKPPISCYDCTSCKVIVEAIARHIWHKAVFFDVKIIISFLLVAFSLACSWADTSRPVHNPRD